ncbi:MAG: saccharopine dehydrogenase NADP-binding domain-containing protein, partial [Anaerolineales bacterium]|nr:saccharopine dehydrogenase NADP-binding domain-containing protein [Anaerolineales bacterium]
MNYTYAVIGAGRQGVAAAYDMVRFGEAKAVILADVSQANAEEAAARLNQLLDTDIVSAAQIDVSDHAALVALLKPVDAALSAVPYAFNLLVTKACITAGTHMCDLGGNTDMAWSQLALDAEAKAAGVCIIPDNGLQPGMGNTLAVYGMQQMSDPQHARIWVGGLAQKPRPPFDFLLSFHIEGLTNEYDQMSVVIEDGKRVERAPFTGLEEIEFPEPVGKCEAFITTGGTSTAPWTFEGKLQTYVEKTVRYPGHCATFNAFRDLGLFGREA